MLARRWNIAQKGTPKICSMTIDSGIRFMQYAYHRMGGVSAAAVLTTAERMLAPFNFSRIKKTGAYISVVSRVRIPALRKSGHITGIVSAVKSKTAEGKSVKAYMTEPVTPAEKIIASAQAYS